MARANLSKKNKYLNDVFGQDDEFCKKIQEASKQEAVQHMQISQHEARILQFLVQLSKAKKIIEIGTLHAYSALHMAQALPQDGQLWTLDMSKKRHQLAQELLADSPDINKIKWITGPAQTSLKSLESQAPFDMMFIDADKPAYMDYLLWAESHLKPGACLVADNSFLFGAVYGQDQRDHNQQTIDIMKAFNQRLSLSKHWKGALIPTEEGLTVSIKQ